MACVAKFLAFLATLIFISYTTQQENDAAFMQKYNSVNEDCAKQYGFTLDYATKQIWTTKPFPSDNSTKCFFYCVSLKLGTIDETGDVKDDALVKVCAEFYNVTLTAKAGDLCDIAKEGDVCQTAYDLTVCVANVN